MFVADSPNLLLSRGTRQSPEGVLGPFPKGLSLPKCARSKQNQEANSVLQHYPSVVSRSTQLPLQLSLGFHSIKYVCLEKDLLDEYS